MISIIRAQILDGWHNFDEAGQYPKVSLRMNRVTEQHGVIKKMLDWLS